MEIVRTLKKGGGPGGGLLYVDREFDVVELLEVKMCIRHLDT